MIRIFQLPEYNQLKLSSLHEIENFSEVVRNILWIDLQNPTPEQIREVEEFYNINFPTRQQQEEIETSSRYLENSGVIKINSTFINIIPYSGKIEEHEMSFIITEKTLFTLRYFDSRVISETVKKIKQFPGIFANSVKIFIAILEARTDFDADLMELVSKYVADISKKIPHDNKDEKMILKINEYQDLTMSLREALFDKQRVLSSLHRNEDLMVDSYNRIRIIIKDINSLIEHANFNFTRLEYLQNSFLGLLNIEQNKVIKTFTVASLVFMPPTLIASLYGMNFKFMPELDWVFGYPLAIGLMLISSIAPLAIFKRKKLL
ncbi:MAG: magnesium and cobalt transport protein CorA [Alphaproteobacteria bacterium RIFCSPLOWO2_01_FULL_40_26]|nr:MAG: magnesium and cobalt transport protein CorA [Alphaproteobacteria bacterium RIFCSPHIGHO2_02_FULL_40_34]OFW95376.1 MAG: magnesium and cobalt transport protein CorA [Alphaproteobacteria bacterium RIFCSPLOWO2_01_FULL_40_26]OFX09272.1 MAG: magnesium and cobalt transport protein CorA [Alphaproteobacteria bacterium RIFCSPLOWO2_02_FULL_40_19]OFX10810.1 MAG: magnesium and cobalt transport protein CorA [Alphaproteobacteria bacterium RIFCSPLOWO2_12_FULL_40_11]